METRARKTLHNLVLPIYDQISSERQVRAEMEVKYAKVLNRLDRQSKAKINTYSKPRMESYDSPNARMITAPPRVKSQGRGPSNQNTSKNGPSS